MLSTANKAGILFSAVCTLAVLTYILFWMPHSQGHISGLTFLFGPVMTGITAIGSYLIAWSIFKFASAFKGLGDGQSHVQNRLKTVIIALIGVCSIFAIKKIVYSNHGLVLAAYSLPFLATLVILKLMTKEDSMSIRRVSGFGLIGSIIMGINCVAWNLMMHSFDNDWDLMAYSFILYGLWIVGFLIALFVAFIIRESTDSDSPIYPGIVAAICAALDAIIVMSVNKHVNHMDADPALAPFLPFWPLLIGILGGGIVWSWFRCRDYFKFPRAGIHEKSH